MEEHLVFIVDGDFVPRRVEPVVGESIIWENRTGFVQSATLAGKSGFDTGDIKPGERSEPIEFAASGEWTYATKGPGGFEGVIKVRN